MTIYKRTCRTCGDDFSANSYNTQYCPPCKTKRRKDHGKPRRKPARPVVEKPKVVVHQEPDRAMIPLESERLGVCLLCGRPMGPAEQKRIDLLGRAARLLHDAGELGGDR